MTEMRIDGKKYACTSFIDISKEKELADRVELISDTVNSSISLIKVTGNKSQLIFANKAAKEITRSLSAEYVGSVCYKNISHREKPCDHCLMDESSETGEARQKEIAYGDSLYKKHTNYCNDSKRI